MGLRLHIICTTNAKSEEREAVGHFAQHGGARRPARLWHARVERDQSAIFRITTATSRTDHAHEVRWLLARRRVGPAGEGDRVLDLVERRACDAV